MTKTLALALAAGLSLCALPAAAAPVAPAQDAATLAYIDAGFAAMDFDGDGAVSRAEFGRFMQERLERQKAGFDETFSGLDANGDGGISPAEAATIPLLAENFQAVDANGDGVISTEELRAAILASQAS